MYLCIHLSMYQSIDQSINLFQLTIYSNYPSIYLSMNYPSNYLSKHLLIYPDIILYKLSRLSIHVFIYPSIQLINYPSIHPAIHLSSYPSTKISIYQYMQSIYPTFNLSISPSRYLCTERLIAFQFKAD